MVKYSEVTCGECEGQAIFVICEWPPSFYWCRYCHRVFDFEMDDGDDGITWQLRGFSD